MSFRNFPVPLSIESQAFGTFKSMGKKACGPGWEWWGRLPHNNVNFLSTHTLQSWPRRPMENFNPIVVGHGLGEKEMPSLVGWVLVGIFNGKWALCSTCSNQSHYCAARNVALRFFCPLCSESPMKCIPEAKTRVSGWGNLFQWNDDGWAI